MGTPEEIKSKYMGKNESWRESTTLGLMGNLDVLECGVCGDKIGMVYGFDLNGSSFICDFCYDNRQEILGKDYIKQKEKRDKEEEKFQQFLKDNNGNTKKN